MGSYSVLVGVGGTLALIMLALLYSIARNMEAWIRV